MTGSKEWSCTNLGDAERLVARHGRDLRYVHPWRQWLKWDGKRWAKDEDGAIMRCAKDSALTIYIEASEAEGATRREQLSKHAVRAESEKNLRAAIALAQSEPGIPVTVQALDTNGMLLNVLNGTVDLETGRLEKHDRSHLITKLAPVIWDEGATCPLFLGYLHRVLAGDAELMAFLQKAIGYSLTGRTDEQVLFILHGRGANGKSILLEILKRLLGPEYSAQADFGTFLDGRRDGPRNDLAMFPGVRLVAASEAEEGRRFNESIVKSVTGGDSIVARKLYADLFEFSPVFKLWLAANTKPQIRSTGEAMWRRIRLVPFAVTIPEGERDPGLLEKLTGELPGILRWGVEGCLTWQRDGLGQAAAVTAATSAYREESDVLAAFLEQQCVEVVGGRVSSQALFEGYVRWVQHNGERPMSQTAFGLRLVERGYIKIVSSGRKFWAGLTLVPGVDGAAGAGTTRTYGTSPHESVLEKVTESAGMTRTTSGAVAA